MRQTLETVSPELVTSEEEGIEYSNRMLTMQKCSSQSFVCDWNGVCLRRRIG